MCICRQVGPSCDKLVAHCLRLLLLLFVFSNLLLTSLNCFLGFLVLSSSLHDLVLQSLCSHVPVGLGGSEAVSDTGLLRFERLKLVNRLARLLCLLLGQSARHRKAIANTS